MGRPPSHGGPAFRFNPAEVAEMEAILQAHNTAVPAREVLESLANKFSASAERSGKIVVQPKQVWNWFQNRRYALRAKADKTPGKLNLQSMPQEESSIVKNVAQAPQPPQSVPASTAAVRIVPQAPQPLPAPSGKNGSDNSQEFEAKSARDGAWYDVATFLSHRYLETNDPEVLVRFAGFGPEEDEWVNVKKHVRQRSLPCESSECVAVLPKDLILCFQEGKEQALYFDAHVLDAQRRRHDVRGCRCRFLVRYVHDQSEEIVPLRKVCRRPETDYRLQQLQAANDSASLNQPNQQKASTPHTGSTLRVYPPAEPAQKQQKTVGRVDAVAVTPPSSHVKSVAPDTKVLQPKIAETANVPVNSGNISSLPGIVTATGAIVTSTTSNVLPVNNTASAGDIISTPSPVNIPAAKATVQKTIVNATLGNVAGNRTYADVSPTNVLATNAAAANANMASGNIVGNVDTPVSNVPAAEATVVDTDMNVSVGNVASNIGNVDILLGDFHATNIAVANTSTYAAPSNDDGDTGNTDALLCNLPVTNVDPSNTSTNATLGDATSNMEDVDFRLDNVSGASPAVSKPNMDVTSGDASVTGAPVSSTNMDTTPGDAPAPSAAASSPDMTVTTPSNAADYMRDVNVRLGTSASMNSSLANANTGGSGENTS